MMEVGSRNRTLALTFFFNDTATTEIYTLSLHDALPIYDIKMGGTVDDSTCGATLVWAILQNVANDHACGLEIGRAHV